MPGDELIFREKFFRIVEKTKTYVTDGCKGMMKVKYAMCLKLDKSLPEIDWFLWTLWDKVYREALNNGRSMNLIWIIKPIMNSELILHQILATVRSLSDPVGHCSYNQ